MFPLYELVTHAESSKVRSVPAKAAEARRSPRRPRFGNLTLYPLVDRPEPLDPLEEDPTVIAAVSNVSRHGMALVHSDPMPEGTVFDVDYEHDGERIPVQLEVVYTRQIAPRMYRTGARVISKTLLPDEPMPEPIRERLTPMELAASPTGDNAQPAAPAAESPLPAQVASERIEAARILPERGVMRIEPARSATPAGAPAFTPPNTLRISDATPQIVTTQRLNGVSPCGFDRNVEVSRSGDRLWIYIHSPGKKNGWGIYVSPAEFQAALAASQGAAARTTGVSLAA